MILYYVVNAINLQSAHRNKANPIPLENFSRNSFEGNITAFNTAWTGKKQDFPAHCAEDLGISQQAFQALEILFPYLDHVFRANGSAVSPEKQSTIANHLNGLQRLCDIIFDPELKRSLSRSLHHDFEDLEKKTRLSLILHDLPEIPGEISNFRQRLPKASSDGTPTEKDRKGLENRLAEFLLNSALRAAYKDQNFLDSNLGQAIKECQRKIKATTDSAIERYKIVEGFINEQSSRLSSEQTSTGFDQDFTQLTEAYYLSEGEHKAGTNESRLKKLIKLLDKLDSKIHIGTVSDFSGYDFPSSTQDFVTQEHKQDKDTLSEFLKVDILKPIAIKLVEIFDSLKNLFCEWDILKTTYENFNWQEVLGD